MKGEDETKRTREDALARHRHRYRVAGANEEKNSASHTFCVVITRSVGRDVTELSTERTQAMHAEISAHCTGKPAANIWVRIPQYG